MVTPTQYRSARTYSPDAVSGDSFFPPGPVFIATAFFGITHHPTHDNFDDNVRHHNSHSLQPPPFSFTLCPPLPYLIMLCIPPLCESYAFSLTHDL